MASRPATSPGSSSCRTIPYRHILRCSNRRASSWLGATAARSSTQRTALAPCGSAPFSFKIAVVPTGKICGPSDFDRCRYSVSNKRENCQVQIRHIRSDRLHRQFRPLNTCGSNETRKGAVVFAPFRPVAVRRKSRTLMALALLKDSATRRPGSDQELERVLRGVMRRTWTSLITVCDLAPARLARIGRVIPGCPLGHTDPAAIEGAKRRSALPSWMPSCLSRGSRLLSILILKARSCDAETEAARHRRYGWRDGETLQSKAA